jgi:hypothetical protein
LIWVVYTVRVAVSVTTEGFAMHHRQTYRWAIFALLLCAFLGITPAALAAPQAAQAVAATEQATIYLVAIGDNGQSGTQIGCGDSLIPVAVNVPAANTTEGKITQALTTLFAIKQQFYGQSGLENSLYQSNLTVSRVELQGSVAAIYLAGSLSLGGVCDDPRAEGQITATAMHLPGVTQAIVIFNGGPLTNEVGSLTFPQTGHSVAPPFFPYWQDQGGLPVFGYPLTDQLVENGYRAQYFERQRFEAHPENAAPYNVLFGLLGLQDAQKAGLVTTAPFQPQPQSSNPNCEYFPQTGHSMCADFRAYWHNHGLDFSEPGFSARESLALFGYPISEPFQMKLEDGHTYTVQYFERVRMELHPENNPPYNVLLGRLAAGLVP